MRKLLNLLPLGLLMLFAGCPLPTSGDGTPIVHHSSITVTMRNQTTVEETATVRIDGAELGVADDQHSISEEVAPGLHVISCTTVTVPTTFTSTVTVDSGTKMEYALNLTDAFVTANVDAAWALEGKTFRVSDWEDRVIGTVEPGGNASALVTPHQNAIFVFRSTDGKVLQDIYSDVPYSSKFSVTLNR